MKTDRLPPHAIDAEVAILGCILVSPNDCLNQCILHLKAGVEVFYDLRHKSIYKVLIEMYDARDPIDVITVQQRLKDRQLLEEIGGIPYLIALQDAVTSTANVTYYAEILQEKYLLRKLVHVCSDAVCKVYESTGTVDELMDEVERDILKISQSHLTGGSVATKQLVPGALNKIEAYFNNGGKIMGLETGFTDLDRLLDGMHPGEMIVIAARPSMGKTSLAMNIAEHVAINLKQPVGVFSLEVQAEQLMLKILCSNARVNIRNIKAGFMAEADFPKLTSSAGRLTNAPLYIDDTPGLTILQLRARARRMVQTHGIKLFVIDYLQLLHGVSRKAQENRQQEIAEISEGVKSLAKELCVPVLVLSQMNREMEKDKSRRPRMSDLRESGAIEQDADVVGLLYKPGETEAEQNDEQDGIPVNLAIAKQRNGPTGDVHFTFLRGYTRFESAAKVADEDVPAARSQYKD